MTRHVSLFLPLTLAVILALAGPAAAHDPRIRFAPGVFDTVVTGHLADELAVTYLLSAEAGQMMTVTLQGTGDAATFHVVPPGTGVAMRGGATEGHAFSAILPKAGDYRIIVQLTRDAILQGDVADYTLGISLNGGAAQPDFADSLSGGPDFWAVSGVGAGDLLNLRDKPGMQGRVLERLPDGAVLRNRGCTMTGSTRWCHVTNTATGTEGWVAGRYLRESAGP